jgi:hypothetical protein
MGHTDSAPSPTTNSTAAAGASCPVVTTATARAASRRQRHATARQHTQIRTHTPSSSKSSPRASSPLIPPPSRRSASGDSARHRPSHHNHLCRHTRQSHTHAHTHVPKTDARAACSLGGTARGVTSSTSAPELAPARAAAPRMECQHAGRGCATAQNQGDKPRDALATAAMSTSTSS